MKVSQARRLLCGLVGAVLLTGVGRAFLAGKVIKLDFGSTAGFTESDGVSGTATASGFSAADKATIIALVQQRFDKASLGNFMVMEGTGGDVDIIVNGGTAPGTNMGKEYGDEGQSGKPGVVHVGEFVNQGFMGAGLTTGVGETIAHEAGHKLGLEHNWDNRPTLMTEGSKVTMAQRLVGNRKFNATDSNTLTKNQGNAKSEHKDNVGLNNLLVFVGERVGPPPNPPDDRYLNCYAIFNAPVGWEFGFMSPTGEFVFQGDFNNTLSNPAFMSLPYSAGLDLAVRLSPTVHKMSDGSSIATSSLSVVNPNNAAVFQQADVIFAGGVQLTLKATIDPTTGGFMNGSPQNQSLPVQAMINQAQETPPTGSSAQGFGLFVFNTSNNSLSFNINITPLPSGEVAAHLHQGAVGVAGPIIAPLPLGNSINGTLSIPPNQVGNVLSGNTYVNFHSNAFPNGEIRGQVLVPPTTGTRLCELGNVTMPCPCGNPPAGLDRGCDNSSVTGGAVLAAMGNASLGFDTLVFSTLSEKPTATTILLQGSIANPTGVVFGQGIRCAVGTLKRLFTKNAVGGSIEAPSPTDQRTSAKSAALGDTILAGSNRSYLAYYRDPTVLGGCPAGSTFNATQTISVTWGP